MNNNDKGFTIVELVVVIILLAVLAVTAIPRAFDTPEFAATTDRDQTIALLLSAQTRAMQNTERYVDFFGNSYKKCHKVGFTATEIGLIARASDGTCTNDFVTKIDQTNDFLRIKPETSFTVRNSANAVVTEIEFNDGGQPIPQTGYKITFDSNVSLCIESEGYIHVCS